MTITAAQFKRKTQDDASTSFWLQRSMRDAEQRDCLDALIDAEALLVYCKLRCQEAGITIPANLLTYQLGTLHSR